MKYLSILFCTIFSVYLIGCSSSSVSQSSIPTSDDAYTQLPFKKIINPAFAEEAEGKWVSCKARFRSIHGTNLMSLLPSEYQKDYVGFMICDVDDVTAITTWVVIPKSKSDVIFELKTGDVIDLFAYLVSIKTLRGQPSVLFEVEKVKKLQK